MKVNKEIKLLEYKNSIWNLSITSFSILAFLSPLIFIFATFRNTFEFGVVTTLVVMISFIGLVFLLIIIKEFFIILNRKIRIYIVKILISYGVINDEN